MPTYCLSFSPQHYTWEVEPCVICGALHAACVVSVKGSPALFVIKKKKPILMTCLLSIKFSVNGEIIVIKELLNVYK